MISIPVEIGDTILTGKFKNKAVVVKTIGVDDHGMATINGKKVVTFRIKKEEKLGESKMSKKKQKLDEGLVMMASLLPVGGVIGLLPKRVDNFKFKGLPGQFNENGDKVLDEFGDPIKVKEEETKVVKEEKMDAKYYKNLLADVEDGLNELANVGEDYGVFQNAKNAAKSLKQAYKLVNGVK